MDQELIKKSGVVHLPKQQTHFTLTMKCVSSFTWRIQTPRSVKPSREG